MTTLAQLQGILAQAGPAGTPLEGLLAPQPEDLLGRPTGRPRLPLMNDRARAGAQLSPEQQGAMLAQVRSGLPDVPRGAAVALPAGAADVAGMVTGTMNALGQDLQSELGMEPSNFAPSITGDPIREAAGLDPASAGGIAGEMVSPQAAFSKPVGAIAKALGTLAQDGGKLVSEAGALAAGVPLGRAVAMQDQAMSTRVPTAIKANEDPYDSLLTIDREAARQDESQYAKSVSLFRNTPNVPTRLQNAPVEDLDEYMNDHMTGNLLEIYNEMPDEIRDRAKMWYVGANRWANNLAEQFGMEPRQTAAMIAAMSPQKDWFQNASLAERLLHVPSRVTADRAMDEVANRIYADGPNRIIYEAIRNTPAEELDPQEAALMYRLYSETYHDPGYRVLTPEGELGDFVKTKAGNPRAVAWGSASQIGNALRAMRDPNPENIFSSIGQQHKVRNFYNNIIAPDSPLGFVTADTHQVAANMLRPLSGNSTEVLQNLGSTATSAFTGAKGTYAQHADAVRAAATQAGILPREMQSITWEGVRGLFTDVQKRDPRITNGANRIWYNYQLGRITEGEAREQIFELAGGINTPDWAKPGSTNAGQARDRSFERNVSQR